MIGPIFQRETATLPRRSRHFIHRVVFAMMLFGIVCTTWLLLAGIQPVQNAGDLARFGVLIFQLIAPFQMIVLLFTAALAGSSAVSHEKDKQTLILLLMSSLSNTEMVLGKIGAGLLASLNAFLASLPILFAMTLLGGVSLEQVVACTWVTLCTLIASASLGATIAFWREKTFQAITVTMLFIALWLAFGELIAAGKIPLVAPSIATIISPLRAMMDVSQPIATPQVLAIGLPAGNAILSGGFMLLVAFGLCWLSIQKLRIWNPSRERRSTTNPSDEPATITNTAQASTASLVGTTNEPSAEPATVVRTVKAWKSRAPRRVWNNPVLWREIRTWAYGRKVLFIRLAYLSIAALVGLGLQQSIASGIAMQATSFHDELIPATVTLIAPFIVLSLIIINALAVNSISNERDAGALDLLLVTEVSPPKFLLGKIFGVLYVTKEMVVAPLALCVLMWIQSALSTENFVFTSITLIVMDFFVVMLGIHCGMIYSQSRMSISTSLGTVFFLFLGVAMCMLIMLMFRGSFGRQLAPFLFIILGGGTGLYVAIGSRNPSPAITIGSFLLPFLTFFAITSFILRDQELTVFSVVSLSYAFTTAAMMVPALSEFDFAFGRSRMADEE
jgi:ABC-type transport system involved in multi-copper enzyme maturation permease subunit